MIDLSPDLYMRGLPDFALKFQHATQHLNALMADIGPFIEDGLHADSGGKFDIDDEWLVIRWGDVAPVPVHWPLILGDFLHNARSCLDHLLTALVVAHTGAASRNSQFPIYSDEQAWNIDIERRDPAAKPSPIAGVSPAVALAVKEMQPFREGTAKARQADGLMHLLRMSNADKHRLLHTGAVHTGKIDTLAFDPPGYFRIVKRRAPSPGGQVRAGAEIARVRIEKLREPDQEIAAPQCGGSGPVRPHG